jgi:hypothetical protein
MSQLPLWVAVSQIAASIILGVAAFFVAALSSYFSYRNNFGWKPRCLLIKDGFGHYGANPEMWTFLVTFAVWNMRKYPIVVKRITVRPDKLRFNTEIVTEMWDVTSPDEITRTRGGDLVIAPISSHTFTADSVLVNPGDLAHVYETVFVTVTYFDPRLKKERTTKMKYKHGFYRRKRFRWF